MKKLLLIILIGGLSTSANAQTSVGETAPDFTLPVINTSSTFSISDYADKVVYIFFYGANCSHCKNNGPVTETDIHQEFKNDTNFVAIGIDTWNSNISSNNAFRNITGITYPLLLNGQQVLVDYYGNTSSYDRSLVVGFNNTVVYKGSLFVSQDTNDVKEAIEQELATLSTSSEFDNELPQQVRLHQNYPNPFNPSTNIQFELDQTSEIELAIYDVIGNKLSTIASGSYAAGTHSVSWNASNFPSGVYLYRLQTATQSFTQRMLLVK
jgi:peroxiredoxin